MRDVVGCTFIGEDEVQGAQLYLYILQERGVRRAYLERCLADRHWMLVFGGPPDVALELLQRNIVVGTHFRVSLHRATDTGFFSGEGS